MAIVSNDLLDAALTGFRSNFNDAFPAAMLPQVWPEMTMQIPSTKKIEQIDWFGTVPTMRDATRGETVYQDLEDYSYSLEAITYKSAISIQRRAFEDDNARILPKSRQLAQEAARHPGELIMDQFESGTSDLAFDGVSFLNNSRTLNNSGTIDNIISGAYGDGTVAEFSAGLKAAQGQIASFNDDQGRPLQLVGNMIVIPPALVETAWQTLNRGDGTKSAVEAAPVGAQRAFNAAGYRVIVNPYLTVSDNWYLVHSGAGEIRPFIFVDRVSPSVDGPASVNDPEVRDKDRMNYVVRGRYVTGYGDPRYIIQVVDA